MNLTSQVPSGSSSPSRVLATVGLCGTGKSVATSFLAERLDAEIVYFGGFVIEEIHARGLQLNPETERQVSEEMRRERGMEIIARLAVERVRSTLREGRDVVVDGLYSFAEYELLAETLGHQLVVIALHSKRAIRYDRMRNRPQRPLQPNEVDQRDLAEIRNLDKASPIVLADHHIVNDGTLRELQEKLNRIVADLRMTQQ